MKQSFHFQEWMVRLGTLKIYDSIGYLNYAENTVFIFGQYCHFPVYDKLTEVRNCIDLDMLIF